MSVSRFKCGKCMYYEECDSTSGGACEYYAPLFDDEEDELISNDHAERERALYRADFWKYVSEFSDGNMEY